MASAATDGEFLDRMLEGLPPEQVVTVLLDRAAKQRASDLFLTSNHEDVLVQVRSHGFVRPLARIPLEQGHRCIGYIKAMAGMDTSERRRPLEGRWVHRMGDSRVDLRVNTLPTLYGEDCSLRLFLADKDLRELEGLGLVRRELNDLLTMLNRPSGLILVTGPTCCGKTTTLYACLRYLNNGERKINTIEDPIEYGLPDIHQSQVNPKIDLDFSELLRGVLRQAPDVIMIGEIRDGLTAATAVHAANRGHLVLATMHSPTAVAAVKGLRGWEVAPQFLSASLLGVIAQRLVRTLCTECRTMFSLPEEADTFTEVQPWLQPGEGLSLYSARGCPACQMSGYTGRTGVFEVMRVSGAFRRLIASDQPVEALHEQSAREGMIELRKAALIKMARGLTTPEEVVRAVPPEYLGLEG
jgi:type II secretory ATPase GspE/PulE/Tfp pilus assembly ATPase PilB-like protein